jgi:hypothetical protein
MKGYTLDVSSTRITPAIVLGILIASNSREREGVKLGISERVSPDFTVRLGTQVNSPEIADGRIVDCVPVIRFGAKPGENTIWLERTPADQAQANKSLVHLTGFEGYTLVAGSPKPLAAGPGTLLARMKPNSAISFVRPDGNAFVMYTHNDARRVQVIEADKFAANLLTADDMSAQATGAEISR